MISEFLARTSIQFVSGGKNIFVGESLNGGSLRNKSAEQAVVLFVLRALPRCVGMSKESFGSPLFHLSEVGKLAAIVDCNGLKDTGEVFAVFIVQRGHETHHSFAGLAGNTERQVGFCLLFQ